MFYRLPRFNYYRPKTLNEALDLLDKLDDYKILAGGTDLLIDMRIGRYKPNNIIDINGLKELEYVRVEDNIVRIGALTRLQDLVENNIIREKLPLLHQAVYNMASWQIRNMATIGGNLCNASPAADTAPPLMTYNAELVLASVNGERRVSIHEFFKGPRKTVLARNELLKEIRIPIVNDYGYSYIKLGRRNAFTLSIVSVATLVKIRGDEFVDVRIALNSVAPTPVRAKSVENYLIGREISEDNVWSASKLVVNDISPITDVRATAEYRRKASIVLVHDTLLKALKTLGREV
jgi:carbon-monoxide dehydrogenase medium subunit